jgi:hypothetical protein
VSALGRVLVESGSEIDVAVIECVCDGRPRIGLDACQDCEVTYQSMLLLLRRNSESLAGNPMWVVGWALSRVIGSEHVDWETVRHLAAEFEDIPSFN